MDDGEVYRKYADELMRFAAAMAGPSGAEDLLSAAFLGAIQSPGWSTVDNKRAYLYRVVLNHATQIRRSTDRRLRREERTALRERVEPTDIVDVDVIVALRRLTVRQRAIVFLTYWADLGPTTIAETIGSSTRTVERELATAKSRLESLLS